MKNIFIIISIIMIFSISLFSQPAKPSTDKEKRNPSKSEVVTQKNDVQFSMAGLLFLSAQSWSDLETDSKFGFGINGDLFAGILFSDMYVGIGPHFGFNAWQGTEHDVDVSATVSDFGVDLGVAWQSLYLTLGTGSSNATITGSYGGYEESMKFSGIGYTSFGFGFFDGYAIGLAFVSYNKDEIENLDRFEVNFGWAF